jgi:hypothetical protein
MLFYWGKVGFDDVKSGFVRLSILRNSATFARMRLCKNALQALM